MVAISTLSARLRRRSRWLWLCATLLLAGCPGDEHQPPPPPVIVTAFASDDITFEGQPARFTATGSGLDRWTIDRSDDAGIHFNQVDAGFSDHDVVTTVRYETPPVDYERDHSATFRLSLVAEPTDPKSSDESFTSDGPVTIKHIVRFTGFDHEPADTTTGAGGSARFEPVLHGERLVYQWQRSDDGGATPHDLAGQTAATLQIDNVQIADNGALLRVQVSGWNGNATSRWARLTVSPTPPMRFHDEDFADNDWTVETLQAGSGGTASAQHANADGNPGGRRLNIVWVNDAKADAPAAVYMLNWRHGASYTPASAGAILSIDYSEDQRRDPTTQEQSSALIARQAGHLYYAAATSTSETVWTNKPRIALGPADFVLLSGADPNRALDFSAAGGAIEFGYLRANNVGAGTVGVITTGDIDNWSVTVWR